MKPDTIVIHHSAGTDHPVLDWPGLRRYHVQERGYRDIGYHYGLDLVGDRYEVLTGRMMNEDGAHCTGMNSRAIGICFVGNFEEMPVPAEQWRLGVRLVTALCEDLGIPITRVLGHRECKATACPGKLFVLERFRQEVSDALFGGRVVQ